MTRHLHRLGRACSRHRWRVVLIWVLVAATALGLAQTVGGEPNDRFDVPGVESQRAVDVLEDRFPSASGTSAQLVFASDHGSVAAPEVAEAIDAALADVGDQPDVASVSELNIAPSGAIGYADVQYSEPSNEIGEDAFHRLEQTAGAVEADGLRLELGGQLPTDAINEPPEGQEMVGLVAATIILLVAFGSVVGMGLPIGTALLGLATSLGLIGLAAAAFDVSDLAPTLAAMIGLGVGIDYALFIVTRHREYLAQGMTIEEAAGRAVATSGAAVLFAGLTVVIAICGLALADIPLVTVMGLMSALTVLVMVAISLTLLPALLGFAGHLVNGRRARRAAASTSENMWQRWGRTVSLRPWRSLVVGTLALLVLAAPVLTLRLGMADNGNRPEELTNRQAYDLLQDGFGDGFNAPLVLAAELNGSESEVALEPLARSIAADGGVEVVSPPQLSPSGDAAVIRVIPTTSPQAEATTELVHRLREEVIPRGIEGTDVAVHVGGQTATLIDVSDKISERLPIFMGTVIGLSVVLLTVVFRSIAVPLKAAAMNLLSIGAAYGAVVAVFQWGWFRDLFGIEETVPIIAFVPLLMFAVLFGLSMDYEVFLLSRVRERYLESRDNTGAVIEGLSSTGRVITSAALIMIAVFGSFVLGDQIEIKMFGLGLAVAVFIDATLVRVVLVPATMRLLGDWNWWVPSWLDRILPDIDLEGETGLPEPEYERDPREAPHPDAELVGAT